MGIIPELPHMMRDVGFEEVHVEWYTWPTVCQLAQLSLYQIDVLTPAWLKRINGPKSRD